MKNVIENKREISKTLDDKRVASIENKTINDAGVGVIVKYANRLISHDIAKMNPISQNLMSLLFAIWTKDPQPSISIGIDLLRKQLQFNRQSGQHIEKVIDRTAKDIIEKSFVEGYDSRGRLVIGYMIYQFSFDFSSQSLEVKTSPDFMELFKEKEKYTSYNLLTFYSIKPKQAKNLYRLFCRNFKGHFSIDWEELRSWMGYKPTATNGNVMVAIKKAQKYLVDHHYLEKCEFSIKHKPGLGSPIEKINFEYIFAESNHLKKLDKTISESPQGNDKSETRPYTKEDETALWDDFKPKEPEPEAAITSATPPDFSKLIAKSKEDVKLPTIADLPPLPPKEPEPEPKPLKHHCPLCNKPMQIRQNKESGAYFWGCDRGHPTITLTPEEVRQYKNQKK